MSDPTHPFVARFAPGNTDPDALEALLVQSALAEDAAERIQESARTGNKHHLLLVGPRGTGKTHLVTLLVRRIRNLPDLEDRLCIAWIRETTTTTSYLDLLLHIHRALGEADPEQFPPDLLDSLPDLAPDAATSRLARLLVERLRPRTLLLVVERLDEVFNALGDLGQKQWRALLQENPHFTILATTRRIFPGVASRQSPFFGFFQVEHLKPLTPEQALSLLTRFASLRQDRDLVDSLKTPTGKSRVHALHHLAGGNHRFFVSCAKHLTRSRLDEMAHLLLETLDDLAPEHRARIARLSPQQRRLVEFLAQCDHPVPVKEMARNLFVTNQTASGQLKDLREHDHVASQTRGRESLYEIQDPLTRLGARQDRGETGKAPFRDLLTFLRRWYEALPGGHSPSRKPVALATGSRIRELIEAGAEPTGWQPRVRNLVRAHDREGTLMDLGVALVRSLAALSPESLEAHELELWRDTWSKETRHHPQLDLARRLFETGLLYRTTRDPKELLRLPAEERKILAFLDQEESSAVEGR